ncbi:MAG: thermonuclease family protein [Ignavibacteria bacterium]|nr:thermonuclease family protein [Ignavibacteria bacterium]
MKYLAILFSILFVLRTGCAQTDATMVIGDFKITKITDADTFRFDKLDRPARLLGIDTEETFKTPDAEQKTAEIAQNWDEFYKLQKGNSRFPVKTDSPMGFEAWKWAEEFMKDVDYVRLEREGDGRDKDIFDRYLVYVIAVKNGEEINYNVECVRNGYSPYFNKYGNSKRFHNEFTEAQRYAMDNKLGIWNPEKKKYPDYEERLNWWNVRAVQLEQFSENHKGREGYFDLNSTEDYEKLSSFVGKEIVVFGGIGNVMTDRFPYIFRIPVRKDMNFDLVVKQSDSNVLDQIDIDYVKEYYTYAKGTLETYDGRYQIVIRDKGQIWME